MHCLFRRLNNFATKPHKHFVLFILYNKRIAIVNKNKLPQMVTVAIKLKLILRAVSNQFATAVSRRRAVASTVCRARRGTKLRINTVKKQNILKFMQLTATKPE